MEHSFDIDLAGDFDLGGNDELPPGVQAGTLPAPDEEQEPGPSPAEEIAATPTDTPWDGEIVEGSLGGEDPDEGDPAATGAIATTMPPEGEVFTTSSPEVTAPDPASIKGEKALDAFEAEQETAVEAPPKKRAPRKKAEPKKAPKAKAAKKSAPPVVAAASPSVPLASSNGKSGTADRLYLIFLMEPTEVNGNIMDVPVRVAFTDKDGKQVDGVRARNRDLAESKAAKTFGEGWRGKLVAVPENYWQPHEMFNEPSGGFTPKRVG